MDDDTIEEKGSEDPPRVEAAENHRPERDAQGRLLPGNEYRWKPGQSGNAKGRPLKLVHLLRDQLQAIAKADSQGRPVAHFVVAALIKKALGGDVRAAREILDRIEGKTPLTVNLQQHDDAESQTDLMITVIPSPLHPAQELIGVHIDDDPAPALPVEPERPRGFDALDQE